MIVQHRPPGCGIGAFGAFAAERVFIVPGRQVPGRTTRLLAQKSSLATASGSFPFIAPVPAVHAGDESFGMAVTDPVRPGHFLPGRSLPFESRSGPSAPRPYVGGRNSKCMHSARPRRAPRATMYRRATPSGMALVVLGASAKLQRARRQHPFLSAESSLVANFDSACCRRLFHVFH